LLIVNQKQTFWSERKVMIDKLTGKKVALKEINSFLSQYPEIKLQYHLGLNSKS